MTDSLEAASPMHKDALHDSGYRHTSGEALYVDDIPAPPGMLVATMVVSPHAHGRITGRRAEAALEIDGVEAVLFSSDVPGTNLIGPIVADEPLLAEDEVHYCGQVVAMVVGETYEACRAGVAAVEVDYEPLDAMVDLQHAIKAEAFHTPPHLIRRGDVDGVLAAAAVRLSGEVHNGAQDHFYLETHASLALPLEDGNLHILSSSQHPTEVQKAVGHVLGLGSHRVVCEVPRMGGAFGGKESQATNYACLAALGAVATGRPVRVWLNRDDDMIQTGKRHPFWSSYEAGFDAAGHLVALQVRIYADAGWSQDLSQPIVDRALFHIDNAYYLEHVDFEGRICRTNLPSNTAFRGFGGPQGMLVVEDALNRYAERHSIDPAEIRRRNFYGPSPRNRAPYGQEIKDSRLERIWDELMASSEYAQRRAEIEASNAQARHVTRGIGFQPVKFGISFTKSILNQAGALVLVYTDGTVQLNHGGTEMGQGLHTKMLAVCGHELGVRQEDIRIMHTATDKVPNTSATAASAGSDLNGQAVLDACQTLRERMRPKAAELLGIDPRDAAGIVFSDSRVFWPGRSKDVPFAEVANACWLDQIPLSSTGYYSTPGIAYDAETGQGTPFYYYAYGGAVIEVEVSALTGESRILRADILHDVGTSLVPTIDIGQVEGGFVQGLGWLTNEEVLFGAEGKPLTTGPSTYKIPAVGDVPLDFRVALLERAPQPGVIHGSKAVGEPPLMLAIGIITALRHAIGAHGQKRHEVHLQPPCTPEAILRAIESQKARAQTAGNAGARKVAAVF